MVISNIRPTERYTSNSKTVFPFNIVEMQVTDPETGKTRTQYEYDEARITGEVTRDKIIMAGIAARYSIEDELATINNYLADKVKYEAEYQEYQDFRAGVKTAMTAIISAQAVEL